MRHLLSCVALAAMPALAADLPAPVDTDAAKRALAPCEECGVVRSIRLVKKEIKPDAATDAKPSGLVASFPLGGGKPETGPSQRVGKDKVEMSESWEVIVRLDDGRFRVVMLDDEPRVREGDKVRFDALGKLTLRAN